MVSRFLKTSQFKQSDDKNRKPEASILKPNLPLQSPRACGGSPPSCLRGKPPSTIESLGSAIEINTEATCLSFPEKCITNIWKPVEFQFVFLLSDVTFLTAAGKEGRTGPAPGRCPGTIITAFLLKSISVFPKKASCKRKRKEKI